ncbi:MAG: HNH endonuclease, partial [Actinomycetota bacterium]|nr:HNH endonuclease [Actinomycetota bacterium]
SPTSPPVNINYKPWPSAPWWRRAPPGPIGSGHVVVVHLQAEKDGAAAHLHLGPALPDSLRRLLGCDGRVRGQLDAGAAPLSVGRAQRIVPERTRLAVEERDGACRVPGCERTRCLQVHHVVHWEDVVDRHRQPGGAVWAPPPPAPPGRPWHRRQCR